MRRKRTKKNRGGRPSKYSRAVAGRICREVAKGSTREGAAALAGISERTLFEWRAASPEFADALQKADARFQAAAVATIRKAARQPRNWTAMAWLLERKFPQQWGRIDRQLARGDAPPVALPDEYKKAISRALGFTGVLVPLRAQDITGETPKALPPAQDNGRQSNSNIDLEILPP